MPYLDILSFVLSVTQSLPYPSSSLLSLYLTAFCQVYEFDYVIKVTVNGEMAGTGKEAS